MSRITESMLRQAIRAQIIRTLTEAPERPQAAAGRVDLASIAGDVAEEIHKRELVRLQGMDRETTKYSARQLPPHAKAIEALKSGAKLVKVMARGAKEGKPMHLVIRAADDAPMAISVVKSRSRQGAVRDEGTRVFLFDDESELRSFLDTALEKHDMKVGELKMASLGAHTETGEVSYGYVASLSPL